MSKGSKRRPCLVSRDEELNTVNNDPLRLTEGASPAPYKDLPAREGFSPLFQWGGYVYLDDPLYGYKVFVLFRRLFEFIPKKHQNRIEVIYHKEADNSPASIAWKWTPPPKKIIKKKGLAG